MNGAHIHLIVNHFPIVGVILGFLMLLVSIIFKKVEWSKMVLGLLAFTGILSAGAYFTGEPAEEFLESRPGFEEKYVEEHEETAEAAFIASMITGVLSLGALFYTRKVGFKPLVLFLVLLSSGATSVLMGLTGNTGGQISHPEIRKEKPAP